MSQEDVIALLERAAHDDAVSTRLRAVASPDALVEEAAALGFDVARKCIPDVLSDADLDAIAAAPTDKTCFGTTDCCPPTAHYCSR